MKHNSQLRNIGIIAHVDAGKTTTSERILFYTGKTYRQGETHLGNAVMDFDPQEQKHGITINSAATTVFWHDTQINLIDTPGHIDFNIEVNRSLRVLDGAVMVLDGVAGVEPQTETNWRLADKYHVPKICFINKLDRVGSDYLRVVEMIRERFQVTPLPLQLPIGHENGFIGIVDLLKEEALIWKNGEQGERYESSSIPVDMHESVKFWREHLIEHTLEQDDAALSIWLEGQEPSIEALVQCIRTGTINGKLVPIVCGSAYKNRGIEPLLDAIVSYLPSPEDIKGRAIEMSADANAPFVGLAFKVIANDHGSMTFVRVYRGQLQAGETLINTNTGKKERVARIYEVHANKYREIEKVEAGGIVAMVGLKETTTGHTLCALGTNLVLEEITVPEPVIDVAIETQNLAEQQLLGRALQVLLKEDPSLRARFDSESGQMILSGIGELQLEITQENLHSRFGVKIAMGKPQVAYRETIMQSGRVRHMHKKQTGGPGQYAEVVLQITPLERGKGICFENKITGGAIPREYIPGVENGIRQAALSGVLGGYPCVDISVSLEDGSFHERDSSIMAFELAAISAFNQAMREAHATLLEPIMLVEVLTPPDYVGDCISELNRRRGSVRGQEERFGNLQIEAYVPLSEMFGYIGRLRTISSGRAQFSMQFDHYDPVPSNIETQILQK